MQSPRETVQREAALVLLRDKLSSQKLMRDYFLEIDNYDAAHDCEQEIFFIERRIRLISAPPHVHAGDDC